MVVVDNTVLVDFWMGEPRFREGARVLFEQDSDWCAPDLWRYEFGNVVGKYARLGRVSKRVKDEAWAGCLQMVNTVHEIDVRGIDRLSDESGLKFYDASYVWLAEKLGIRLRTRDRQILNLFPKVALDMPRLD